MCKLHISGFKSFEMIYCDELKLFIVAINIMPQMLSTKGAPIDWSPIVIGHTVWSVV